MTDATIDNDIDVDADVVTDVCKSTHHPHDRTFKQWFSDIEAARSFLTQFLPQEVLAAVDLEQLTLEKNSFLTAAHREKAVDFLFKTRFRGRDGYIYIIWEHQSSSDYWMPLRLYNYIGVVWNHLVNVNRDKAKPLPFIWPVVLFHGEKPYEHPLSMLELLGLNPVALNPDGQINSLFHDLYVTPFNLVDLSRFSDDTLRAMFEDRNLKVLGYLIAFKHIYDPYLGPTVRRQLIAILVKLTKQGKWETTYSIIEYLVDIGNFEDTTDFWTDLKQNVPAEMQEVTMTLRQRFIKEGIEQGRQEGRQEERMHLAKQLLAERNDLSETNLLAWVSRVVGISLEEVRKLYQTH